ncbi:MAG: hypothetical protein P1Q69_13360 [Candidatus Thorarchaeota archaeon]|nr:hypothetical protein [Candidatus Thorarchaeota archaeon]
MTENISSQLKIASAFVFIGFLMTIGMAVGTITDPEGGQFHEPMDPQIIINRLASADIGELYAGLTGVVIDTFFIVGYIAIFYGIFLLIRDEDPFFPKLGFILGITTGMCDMIENAIHVALYAGVPNGWTPDGLLFASLWSFTFIKDLISYMAGMIFVVMLLMTLDGPSKIKLYKIALAVLIGFYVGLGSIAVVENSLLVLRNLSFMIDMLFGAIILNRLSSIFKSDVELTEN